MARTPMMLPRRRGSVLMSTLIFLLITTILLAGVGLCVASHQGRVTREAAYAAALDVAEAGANFELRKISKDASQADQPDKPYQSSAGSGRYSVYCSARTGGGWTPPNPLYIYSTGTIDGVNRTVRISAIKTGGGADYAIFATKTGRFNGVPYIDGNVGTNGTYTFNGGPTITGRVIFNGPGSDFAGNNGGYTGVYNPDPVTWPTVDQLAQKQWPAGGLQTAAGAGNNDNTLCPQISGNTLTLNGNTQVTLVGKPGGANYYLTSLTCNGNAKIAMDNRNGPINIWVGPSGGTGSVKIAGGPAMVSMTTDPTKACRLYCATTTGVTLNGNCDVDLGIYCYNKDAGGNEYGNVTNNGNPTLRGSIIAANVTLNGNPTINYVQGYFDNGGGYYGFDGLWDEINGL